MVVKLLEPVEFQAKVIRLVSQTAAKNSLEMLWSVVQAAGSSDDPGKNSGRMEFIGAAAAMAGRFAELGYAPVADLNRFDAICRGKTSAALLKSA